MQSMAIETEWAIAETFGQVVAVGCQLAVGRSVGPMVYLAEKLPTTHSTGERHCSVTLRSFSSSLSLHWLRILATGHERPCQ